MKPNLPILLVLLTLWLFCASNVNAYQVPPLPSNNLVVNPWFRSNSDPNDSALDDWVCVPISGGYGWHTSQKSSNPTADVVVSGICGNNQNYCGTSARWADGIGQSNGCGIGTGGLDAYLYQVIPANSNYKTLKFQTYYVTQNLEHLKITIFGGSTQNGPWETVWVPLEQTSQVGSGLEWILSPLSKTQLSSGHSYYKLEIQGKYSSGTNAGVKITGVYFNASQENNLTPTPTPTTSSVLGDINGDGIVDILDYTLLSNAFATNDTASDLNSDGIVNVLDYTILSNNFSLSTGPTPTPTSTQSTPTQTPSIIPSPGTNLLVNPQFHDGFNGWSMVNGHWSIHEPLSCDPSGTRFVQMDRDTCRTGTCGWPIGEEDWLWQDVYTPNAHSKVTFSVTEAHHMLSGTAEIKIYSSLDGQNWNIAFHRLGVESPYGTGKCISNSPPATFTHEFSDSKPYYRLEIHGKVNEEGDGFLFGNFKLSTGS